MQPEVVNYSLMGLLQRLRGGRQPTDKPAAPRSLARVLEAVVQHARALQVVLVLVGVPGLCLVPLLERSTEFDENALLAGSARPTISFSSPSAYEAGKAFADSLQHTYNTFAFSSALQEALAAAGFAVSNHTFSTAAPHSSSSSGGGGGGGGAGARECVNVHSVLHSPRGDGKEALVLVTPINHQHFKTDFHQDTSGVRLSLALGYALMTHLSRATWLSKEVIWLLPDASCGLVAAVESWTNVYQLLPLSQAGSEPHFKRAGVLQQALLTELPTGAFNRVQIGLEGHAGQLPKLDMFWLYKWYSQAYVTAPVELPELQPQLVAPLQTIYKTLLLPLLPLLPTDRSAAAAAAAAAVHGHLMKMQVMWQFMGRQAKGLPTGAHAAFKGLGVDAATLRVLVRNDDGGQIVGPEGYTGGGNAGSVAAEPVPPADNGPYSHFGDLGIISSSQLVGFDSALLQLGNVMEASLRSCSVLIERFHHSLFLYVLTGLDHYVSVERYIGPLVALICVLVLQAAYICKPQAAAAAAAHPRSEPPMNAPPDAASIHGLQGILHTHALQAPADHPGSAAERQQWVSALQLVLLVHGLATAAAAGLRYVLSPEPDSSHDPGGVGLQNDAKLHLGSDPSFTKSGMQGLGAGVGLLLAAVVVGETVVGLISRCSTLSSRSSGSSGSSSSSNSKGGVFLTKVLVVELSLSAAVLAAVACINWALGYMLCLVLVPLAFVSNVSSNNGKGHSWLHTTIRLTILMGCSPVGLLLALSANAPGVGITNALHLSWLAWLVCNSSWGTYMLACGLYVPMWMLACASTGVSGGV